ncbi:MAG: hypothetical protein ABIL22_05015 [candidate division WOR-3 bacterium]
MKSLILFIILFFFISCEDYYGKPVPLGDEFEDHWCPVNCNGLIGHIEASKINSNEFFIIDEENVYVLGDTTARIVPLFTYLSHQLTTLTSSFLYPQRLLIGTAEGNIYYCTMNEVMTEISTPEINNITFLSFSPLDTTTIFISDGYLLLKSSLPCTSFDTLFYNSERIVNLTIQESGEIFLTTEHNLFHSAIQDSLWDTLFVSATELIKGFTIDRKQNLYLSIHNRILKSENGQYWSELYSDTLGNFSIAGIDDGLLLVHSEGTNVNAFKLQAEGQIHDISTGIVHNFPYLSALPLLIAVNGNRYLMSFNDGDEQESALLSFFDTLLPP